MHHLRLLVHSKGEGENKGKKKSQTRVKNSNYTRLSGQIRGGGGRSKLTLSCLADGSSTTDYTFSLILYLSPPYSFPSITLHPCLLVQQQEQILQNFSFLEGSDKMSIRNVFFLLHVVSQPIVCTVVQSTL
jgi:hypothetical protein